MDGEIENAVEQAVSEIEAVAEESAADEGLASAAARAENAAENAVEDAERARMLAEQSAAELTVAARISLEQIVEGLNSWRQEVDLERSTLSLDLTEMKTVLASLQTAFLLTPSQPSVPVETEMEILETEPELPLPSDAEESPVAERKRRRLI